MQLNNKLYDNLKWITLILLPATSAAYFSLSSVLNLPAAEQVVGTIAVVTTFLGAVLGLSTQSYNNSDQKFDGVMRVDTSDPEKDLFTFELYQAPDGFPDKDQLTFKVSKNSP